MSFRDRLATANAAARTVADEGRAERQRRRDSLPLPSAQDYQPGEVAPSLALPPPTAPVNKSRRKWPWIVGGTVLLLFIIGVANGGDKNSTSTATPAAPQTQAPVVPAQVTLPADLVGKNAQFTDDELRRLGIVNISYASQDAKDQVVLPLANWTVTKVEPAPGAMVSTTDTVVVIATKKAGSIVQQPAPPPGPTTTTGRQTAPTTPAERVETPSERTTVRPQPVVPQRNNDSSGGDTVYYKNCAAARAAGAAPIKSGEPGYRPELDRDKDGTACDK